MSLVITVWNESMGVAVSEGRIAAKINGQYVPIEEDYSKLTRLANGGILGITGNLLDGYPVSVSLRDVVAGWLRPAIVHAAESLGFRELSAYMPELLRHCAKLFPGLKFQVCLLGTDEGVVRGGAWSTDGQAELPCTTGVAWQVLGTAETSAEAHAAVRESLQCSGGMRSLSLTAEMLQGIIRALAPRHQEINDRTRVEFITANETAACATADMITTGTMSADRIVFEPGGESLNGTALAELQADCTANHIAATGGSFPSTAGTSLSPGQTMTLATIPVSIQSAEDVILVNGAVNDSDAGPGFLQVSINVDSDAVFTSSMVTTNTTVPVIAYLSDLSPGSHSITVTLTNKSSTNDLSVGADCLTLTVLQLMGSGAGFAFAPFSGITRPRPLIS